MLCNLLVYLRPIARGGVTGMRRLRLVAALLLVAIVVAAPAALAQHAEAMRPGHIFRDCPECPEMVVVPAGSLLMGSPEGEEGRLGHEGPQRKVTIARSNVRES